MQPAQSPPVSRPSLEEWYASSYVQVLQTSNELGWNGINVRSTQLHSRSFYGINPQTPDDTLVLLQEGSTFMEGYVDSQHFKRHAVPGMLFAIPREVEISNYWNAPIKAVFLGLNRVLLHEMADVTTRGDPEKIQMLPQLGVYDPLLFQLGTALHHEVQNQSLFGALFAESIANTMMYPKNRTVK